VAVLRELGAGTAEAKTIDEVCTTAAEVIEAHSKDIPFAALYLPESNGRTVRLAASAGRAKANILNRAGISLEDNRADAFPGHWAKRFVLGKFSPSQTLRLVSEGRRRRVLGVTRLTPLLWFQFPRKLVEPFSLFVAGISARLELNDFLPRLPAARVFSNRRQHRERARVRRRKRSEALAARAEAEGALREAEGALRKAD
jgi:hypothetical protein